MKLDVINIALGLLSNILGVLLIKYYFSLIKIKKHGGLSIGLIGAGIGAIIIGISLIVRELF